MTPVATANLGNASDVKLLAGLIALAEVADVIGVQEAGDRRHVIEQFCQHTGWIVCFGETDGAPSVCILWNPRAVVGSHAHTRPCTATTDCGHCGVGPDHVKAKVWNKVRIDPRNGDDPFVFINGHLPASLYCQCRNHIGNVMITEADDMVARHEGKIDVVLVCDGNSRAWSRRWKPLRMRGMKQHTWFPTHGLRIIDLTWVLGRKAKAVRFKGKFSDHRWVILRLS